jgi:hypothetical protein
MSVFTPFTNYKVALPALKAGYLMHTGPDFSKSYLQVVTVRNNRKKVAISGAQTNLYDLVISTDPSYEDLHGKLNKNRIVHLHYLAIDQAVNTYLWWLTQPLLSKDVDEILTPTTAGLTNPIELDRWSYEDSMYLRIKQAGSQNYYFNIIEYEVAGYATKPDIDFLHLFANGQAQFVKAGSKLEGLGAYETRVLKELEALKEQARRVA